MEHVLSTYYPHLAYCIHLSDPVLCLWLLSTKQTKKKRKKGTCYSLLCRVITKFPLNSKIHTITSVIFSLPFVQPAKPISCLALWILMKNWAWNSMLPWERIIEAWRPWAWEDWIQIRGLPDLGLWKPDQTLQIISSLACQQYCFGNGVP